MTSALHRQRLEAVLAALRETRARRVLDLGCGGGDLLLPLLREPGVQQVVGIELSAMALQSLRRALAGLSPEIAGKARLIHGSMIAPDPSLAGFDAAVLSESIEHLPPERLSALERTLFHHLRPGHAILTTPNAEFNPLLGVPSHRFRHPDHRFEWDRPKFRAWGRGVARRNGYGIVFADIAGNHPRLGGATQMALFTRKE